LAFDVRESESESEGHRTSFSVARYVALSISHKLRPVRNLKLNSTQIEIRNVA